MKKYQFKIDGKYCSKIHNSFRLGIYYNFNLGVQSGSNQVWVFKLGTQTFTLGQILRNTIILYYLEISQYIEKDYV